MWLSNAKLIFNIPTTVVVGTSAITGETIYEASAATSELLISLEQKTGQARTSELPGKDITGVYCEGRALASDYCPLDVLPDWYKADMTLDIEWDNGNKGKFYTLPTISSRLNLESTFGCPIKGVLLNNQ